MGDRALLIGINRYADPSAAPPLRGCVNDAEDMSGLFTGTFGLPAESIRTLADAAATGAGVREGLRWLREDAQAGDRRVLHVSSHGSYAADDDGDEEDGRDELICLHDLDWADPRTYLRDDEVGRHLATYPAGCKLLVILDCCHSGTGTRELTPPSSTRGLRPGRGPRLLPSATAIRAHAAGSGIAPERQPFVSPHLVLARFTSPPEAVVVRALGQALGGPPARPRSARSVAAAPADSLLIAACRSDQTAADAFLGGAFRGALSYHLGVIVRANPAIRPSDLRDRLVRAMRAGRFDQVPQFEASRARSRGGVLGGAGAGS